MANLHDERGRPRAVAPGGLLLTFAELSPVAAPQAEWSHHCSACGKCCNSPPELSLAELFRHRNTFFGCLTVQRLRRPPAHDPALTSAFDALAGQLWHRLPSALIDTDDVLLATRGFDLGLSDRCPALDEEQRCTLHDRAKPAVCRVVPLDALAPDSAQHLVLHSRRTQARYFGSDCIQPGVRPGFDLITRRLSVVDDVARSALAERRRDLALERRTWGDAVFRLLRAELFASPAALERLPSAGFMTLSIVPVLLVLARDSALRLQCLEYLAAQAQLAERLLERARHAGQAELASVRQLAAFARSNAAFAAQLKE
jgi:Fe-S-cluster containining protein